MAQDALQIQNNAPDHYQTKSVKGSLGSKNEKPYQEISLSNIEIEDDNVPQKRIILVTSAKYSPKALGGTTCLSNDV